MTERPDYLPLTDEDLSARRRQEVVTRTVARILHMAGERDASAELVAIRASAAEKLWARIPDDKLPAMVERARKQHGAPNVTIERVMEAWQTRRRKIVVTKAEQERRRRIVEERIEREKASPEFTRDFFKSMENTFKELR